MEEKIIENRKYVVYKHTSPNNKVYIGVTCQDPPEKRWANGFGYRNNKHFDNAISKYGWQNFSHEILITDLTQKEAAEKEIEFIAQYNAADRNYGYNVSIGGNSLGKLSDEHKQKIGNSGMISVLQYTKSFEFIRRWDSITEASINIGISASLISACCREKEQSAGGFIWRYEFPDLVRNPRGHTNTETYNSVDQYSANGEFLATYNNLETASLKTNIDRSTIGKCCRNEQRKAGGYIWRYHGEELTKEHIKWCNGTGLENRRKVIIQYSLDGKFIRIWESINAITKELGFNNSAIIRCCKDNQKSSYGFIWRYASDIADSITPLCPTPSQAI